MFVHDISPLIIAGIFIILMVIAIVQTNIHKKDGDDFDD